MFQNSLPTLLRTGLFVVVAACGFNTAKAALVINLQQIGSNVVATGSGTANIAELSFSSSIFGVAFIAPSSADILVGVSETSNFFTLIAGPSDFGSGLTVAPNVSIGPRWGAFDTSLVLPQNYVTGNTLSSNSTWTNTTLADLGVTPGTYTWTWGSGANEDSLTLNAVAVPEPTCFAFMGLMCFGFATRVRRKKRSKVPARQFTLPTRT